MAYRSLLGYSCLLLVVQEYPSARTTQALEALALFRGSQAGMEYGEAFQIVRMLTGEQLPWQA